MSEQDGKVKRNILIVVGIVVVLAIGWMLLSKRGKNSKHSKDSKNKNVRNLKESFVDETERDNEDNEDNENNIIENFPQTTPMSVLYSDPSGNLGSTTDLGLQNLTVNGDIKAGSSVYVQGSGNWKPTVSVNAPVAADSLYSLHFGDGTDVHNRQCGMGYIKGQPTKAFGDTRATLATHIHEADDYQIYTSGWKPVFGVKGGSGDAYVRGGLTAGRVVSGGDLNGARALSIQNGVNDWTAQIGNGTGGVNVYMAHGGKYGMHINANNKDMDTYALQCYGGDKHLMTLNGKGNMNVEGDVATNSVSTRSTMNFPNGWSINTTDGHFRIKKDGVDKLVAHADALPVWAANGLNAGEWTGEGGGIVTGNKIAIKQSGTDNKFTFELDTDTERAHENGQRMTIKNKKGSRVLDMFQGEVKNWREGSGEPVSIFSRINPDGFWNNRSYLNVRDYGFYGSTTACGNRTDGHFGCNFANAFS